MQHLEPYYNWRHLYRSEDDERSPFYTMEYSEFEYTNAVYDHYIHPQWDYFGSQTLYMKILYVDYDEGYAIIEFIGEWNDVIENDIKELKDNIIGYLIREGVSKYILITEQVMNIHTLEADYYEEWYEDIEGDDGWIVCINTLPHVEQEWRADGMSPYMFFYQYDKWRTMLPDLFYEVINRKLHFFLD